MEAFRKIVKLQGSSLKLELPEVYKDKTIELVISNVSDDWAASIVKEPQEMYSKSGNAIEINTPFSDIDEKIKSFREKLDGELDTLFKEILLKLAGNKLQESLTNKKVDSSLKKTLTSKKRKQKAFDATPFFGKVDFGMDGLSYQKMIRSEWERKEK